MPPNEGTAPILTVKTETHIDGKPATNYKAEATIDGVQVRISTTITGSDQDQLILNITDSQSKEKITLTTQENGFGFVEYREKDGPQSNQGIARDNAAEIARQGKELLVKGGVTMERLEDYIEDASDNMTTGVALSNIAPRVERGGPLKK